MNSKNTERAKKLQLLPSFQQWFCGSKVVDENNLPLAVYHGTTHQFDSFKDSPNGSFFTDDRDSAFRYGGREPICAYLCIKNPVMINARGAFWNELDQLDDPSIALLREHGAKLFCLDHVKAAAKILGFDGAIIINVTDNSGAGNQFVAFSPAQIRIAPWSIKRERESTPLTETVGL